VPRFSYNYQDETGKVAAFKTLLEQTQGHCPICWFRGEINMHSYYFCSHFQDHRDSWVPFRSSLKLPNNEVCYYCLLPQRAPFNHRLPRAGQRTNPEDCPYPDFLKPLIYMILHDDSTRDSILDWLKVPRSQRTIQYLKTWLRERVLPPSLPRVVELILLYMELRRGTHIDA
jgi:hypothetical protein